MVWPQDSHYNPMDEYMEILPMYEATGQLFWDPKDPSHAKNNKEDQLS